MHGVADLVVQSAASRMMSLSPSAIVAMAGSELATSTTDVPRLRSSRANGSMPRMMSAPELSQKSNALRYGSARAPLKRWRNAS